MKLHVRALGRGVHPVVRRNVSGDTRYWSPGDFEQVNGFPRYPAQEMERRHRWAVDTMDELEIDLLVVGGPTGPLETSVQYFSNWPSQVQSYVILGRDEPPILLVRLWNHVPDAKRISVIDDVRYGGDTPAEQADRVANFASERLARRIGLIGVVPHADLTSIQRANPGAALIDLNGSYQ
ncbi:MAG TPA: aminopeptidase P family N-terminal domain-containing protein, partial [Acidimicrobiia bacterium]|nr:aminopeptidase P family N-terminal domain-containing protein [Acidimicrobiia bacterium]